MRGSPPRAAQIPNVADAIERALIALWVGGMWIGGYVVAPLLFNLLENRQLAGTVGGAMFSAIDRVGLVCGLALVGLALWRAGHRWLRQWRTWMLGAMRALIVVDEFVLLPLIQDLHAPGTNAAPPQAGGHTRFIVLHFLARTVFIINSVLGLGLVIFGAQVPARRAMH